MIATAAVRCLEVDAYAVGIAALAKLLQTFAEDMLFQQNPWQNIWKEFVE